MKSIRNVDVLYTIHEKSRVLEECICRVESACDTGHFESVDSALRTKPELRAGAWRIYPADAGAAEDADAAGIQHGQFGRPGYSGSATGVAVGTGQSVRVLAGPV